MKHLTATVLLCGAAVLGAYAQNIIVTDKDGVTHKFNADYVKEITFEKIQSQGDAVNLDIASVEVNPWSFKNIQLIFDCENGDQITADIYQPETMWLTAGNYVVEGSYAPYTLDPGYSSATIGGEKKDVKAGSIDIKLEGEIYTFTVDLVVGDDMNVKGTYTGKIAKFGPVVNFDLTGVSYANYNDPAPNGFYYNFNDENWKIEMRLELFSEGNAPKPGTYTFSESTDNGCAGSYVSLYSPYNETTKFKEGTVTVEEDGENTVITINGVLENGLPMTASFNGQLPARPSIAQDVELTISTVNVDPYGTTNVVLSLVGDNGDFLELDLYQPSTLWLAAGNYEVGASSAPYIGSDARYSYAMIGGEKKELKSGSLDITLDGEVYTFTVDLVVGDDMNVKGTYTGKIAKFGPVVNFDLTGVSYANYNDPAPNGFYYNFNDENWKIEMRLELFSEGNAPKPGTYTFSESTDNGCAGSYVSLYSPYNETTKFKEGTVTVEEDGENTVITINGVLEIGLPMTASFAGVLPAREAE